MHIRALFLLLVSCIFSAPIASAQTNALNSTGSVGVGTTSPAAQFEVYRTSGGVPPLFRLNTGFGGGNTVDLNPFITGVNNGGFELSIGGARRIVIDPVGNVGVGTLRPVDVLTVNGNVSLEAGGALRLYSNEAHTSWASVLLDGVERFMFTRDLISSGNFAIYGSANSSGTLTLDSTANVTKGNILINPAGGNVGIGTTNPTQKLSVNGTIRAKEVIVETTGWSDYVFADNYDLRPLSEVEQQIKADKHLPGIPSAQEVSEKGIGLGEMQAKLLAKIEELTLHQIAQEKELQRLRLQVAKIPDLEAEVARLHDTR